MAFSQDFKTKHHLFLHSLPMRLETMWALIVGANFWVYLAGLALTAVFWSSAAGHLIAQSAKPPRMLLVVWLAICGVFLMQTCFSLCARQDLHSYLMSFFFGQAVVALLFLLGGLCGFEPGGQLGEVHPGFQAIAFSPLLVDAQSPFYCRRVAANRSVALLAWNPAKSAWTPVAENLLEPEEQNPAIFAEAQLAVYRLKEPAGTGVYLYDGYQAVSRKLGVAANPRPNVSFQALTDKSVVIGVLHGFRRSPDGAEVRLWPRGH